MEKTINECFFHIQNGANIKQGTENGGFPITRIETISNDKFNRDKMGYAGIADISQYKNYILEDNDLLMSHINSPQYLGRTVLYKKVDGETIIHGMNLLRLKATKEVNPSYARYYFYGKKFRQQIAKITKKSVNQASFAINDLKNIKIYLPEIEGQNNIVNILDAISSLIEYYNEILKKYDDLIKARFIEMFGDPLSNEKGWDTIELNFLSNGIGDGLHGTPEYDSNGDYPFINGNNLVNGEIKITSTTKMVNEETYKKYFIDISSNAILLSINGTLGKLACYNGERVMLGKSVCYCNLKPDINREFVYGIMKTDAFAKFLESNATASTIKNVGLKAIREFKLILPPIELQIRYEEFAKQVDKSKLVVQKSLKKTQQLYDSLMQEYFG